jgi:hypothetical protein
MYWRHTGCQVLAVRFICWGRRAAPFTCQAENASIGEWHTLPSRASPPLPGTLQSPFRHRGLFFFVLPTTPRHQQPSARRSAHHMERVHGIPRASPPFSCPGSSEPFRGALLFGDRARPAACGRTIERIFYSFFLRSMRAQSVIGCRSFGDHQPVRCPRDCCVKPSRAFSVGSPNRPASAKKPLPPRLTPSARRSRGSSKKAAP